MPPNTDIMGCGLSLSGCLPVDGAVPAVPLYRLLASSSSTTLVHLFVFCFCFYEPTSGHRRAISMPESRRWTACAQVCSSRFLPSIHRRLQHVEEDNYGNAGRCGVNAAHARMCMRRDP